MYSGAFVFEWAGDGLQTVLGGTLHRIFGTNVALGAHVHGTTAPHTGFNIRIVALQVICHQIDGGASIRYSRFACVEPV